MELGLTIPLQRHLQVKQLAYGNPQHGFYCWDLHKITLHGRPCLLAVHTHTRYALTLFDLSPGQWNGLVSTFLHALQEGLQQAGFANDQIMEYLSRAGAAAYTKTHGRRPVAFLNRAWDDVVAHDYTLDTERQSQPMLNGAVNALPRRCAGQEGLLCSHRRLQLLLDSYKIK